MTDEIEISMFDRALCIHPDFSGLSYWSAHYDGTPWEDPYDGFVLENANYELPSKEELLAIPDAVVRRAKWDREETARKTLRDQESKNNLSLLGLYKLAKQTTPNLGWTGFLDSLEDEWSNLKS